MLLVGSINLIGDTGNLLFVEGLGNLDQLTHVAIEQFLIQVANRGHTHNLHPVVILREDVEHLVPMYIQIEFRGVKTCRQRYVETLMVALDVEQVDITRIGSQCAIEIANDIVHAIQVTIKARTGIEQNNLVVVAVLLIDLFHLGGKHTLANNGIAGVDN